MDLPNVPVVAEDIQRLDNNCVSLGIPKAYLMECAGTLAALKIFEKYQLNSNTRVLILCGIGNNGGDGFVIARHLACRGIHVHVLLIGSPDKIRSPEAQLNWNLVRSLELNLTYSIFSDSTQIQSFTNSLSQYEIIIDALLGTGVKGKIREPISSGINLINFFTGPKIIIDVPSGMNPTTGEIFDKAVLGDFLITFHREKKGLTHFPDKYIVPIGTPLEAHIFVGDGDLQAALKKRQKENYKGQYGKVLVIGGCKDYSGAPALASLTVLELGVDLCICLTSNRVANVIRNYSPNLIVREGCQENLCIEDLNLAKNLAGWADAILIGPGLGQYDESYAFFKELIPWLSALNKPIVIDADGIRMLGKMIKEDNFSIIHRSIVITPHLEELRAIISFDELPKYNDVERRGKLLSESLFSLGGTFLVKGVYDYIIGEFDDGLTYRVNRTGCPEMAVGGTGDVLAGLTVALCSLGNKVADAASVAAYLNGLSGEKVVSEIGIRFSALDLIKNLKSLLHQKKM